MAHILPKYSGFQCLCMDQHTSKRQAQCSWIAWAFLLTEDRILIGSYSTFTCFLKKGTKQIYKLCSLSIDEHSHTAQHSTNNDTNVENIHSNATIAGYKFAYVLHTILAICLLEKMRRMNIHTDTHWSSVHCCTVHTHPTKLIYCKMV